MGALGRGLAGSWLAAGDPVRQHRMPMVQTKQFGPVKREDRVGVKEEEKPRDD